MFNDALFHVRARVESTLIRQLCRLPDTVLYRLAGGQPVVRGKRQLGAQMQLIAWLDSRMRPIHSYPLAEMRERFDYAHCMMSPLKAPPVETVRRRILLRSEAGGVRELPIAVYTPERAPWPKPVLVFYHGGGFCLGSIRSHERFCQFLADAADMVVVSVEYRMAPEHKYPLPAEDVIDAWCWIRENALSLGGRQDLMLVGGDSAGGNLSAVVCQQALLRNLPVPHGQVLIYPATDMRRYHVSHVEMGKGHVLTDDWMEWFLDNYLPQTPGVMEEPLASPLLATPAALNGLPPALVFTCGFDPLRDEGEAYARAMQEQGVEVEFHEFTHLLHGFIGMTGISSQALEGGHEIASRMRNLVARIDRQQR